MKTSWFEAEQAIINTVSYVDVFDYPLTPAEIHRYLIHLPLTSAETHNLLDAGRLVPARLSRRDGLYMLPGREEVAEVRRQRRVASQALWPAAVGYGRAIARMPFVRMVAVTGSLSVNNVMPGGDIDYLAVSYTHLDVYKRQLYEVSPGDNEETARFRALLRSVYRPEALLFPREDEEIAAALPTGVATEEDVARLERLADFLRANFDLRALPIDDLALALADTLFLGARGQGPGVRDESSSAGTWNLEPGTLSLIHI